MTAIISQISLQRAEALRATELFGSLPESILWTVTASSTLRTLSRGEILCSAQEEASALYVVVRGRLRSIRMNVEGREQVLSTEPPGAILAAVALFGGEKVYSTLIADTASQVLAIGRNEMLDLCRRYPELLWSLARTLAQKARSLAELVETLALRQVDQRVAQYLLTICQQRGIGHRTTCLVELTLNRTEIAGRVGSTREVVSRAFTQLEKAGLIQMQGRRLVTIPDMPALRVFAGTDPPTRQTKRVSELQCDSVQPHS
ncbi:MAG TPA: Crp/Fnr family transcriptional regulator [Bryobacteraceae bacterium]|nr:Crp/Fnr family transcriptional regulator [Bryobacteraceae bacterium]